MHTLFEHKSNNKTVNTVFFCTFTMKKLKNMNQNSKLFLLDAYALIYRAYYAFIKNPRINSKGFNTSAILGFVNTLEEVLNSSADKSKEEVSKLRSKAEQALKQSRYRLGETGDAIAKQTRVAAARADEYVRENPWTGVGIGAAIGVVLGVLLSRR